MKKLWVVILILLSAPAIAQQDALFSQYMFNKLVINPAYAGTRQALSVNLVGRKQWAGLNGAPATVTLSVHSPLRNDRMGLGGYVFTDVLGPMVNTGLIATYSYKINLGPGKLSFGLQGGIQYTDVDWSKVEMKDPDDIVYLEDLQQKKKWIPDANFGLYYYGQQFYVGISSKHLFEQQFGLIEDQDNSVYGTLLRHFYLMGGYAFKVKEDRFVIHPSALIKYTKNSPVQADINLSMLFSNIFWIGVSYRTEGTFVALAEVVISDKFRIGYSYDVFLNKLGVSNKGSHEIMIGYDFPVFNNRMLSPRYF